MVRILLADEHRLFREALRKLLEATHDLRVVGEAADGAEAVRLTREWRPDILLLDVPLPRLSGLEVLRELACEPQTTASVLLTGSITPALLLSAQQCGARGLVMKQSPAAVLLRCIRLVMSGHYWIGGESASGLAPPMPPKDFGLTRRELEITAAISAACSNKDIAQRFSLSEKTVKHHLTNIFDKLGVSTRLELAVFARHHLKLDAFEVLLAHDAAPTATFVPFPN